MSFLRSALLLLCLALAGCQPGLPSGDEQKESHFLAAKNRVQERDYDGAIEQFEKALEVNPRSGSAHFELGILYQQHRNDFAAALYHLQKAVALRPDSSASELAKQQMEVCKRELARTVVQLPSMGELQRKIDALREENQMLKERLQAWQSFYEGRGVTLSNVTQTAVTNTAVRTGNSTSLLASRTEIAAVPARTNSVSRSNSPAPSTGSTRTHTIVAGDNFTRIAQKYGVKVTSLQAANPHIDSRRLQPGKTLIIPVQ